MNKKLKWISHNIKAYRTKAGYTEDRIAEKLGISTLDYIKYEVNPRKLRIETLRIIANIFECNISDFFKV